jgi:hypothetical protein
MSLVDDLKTFLMALAIGVAITLSINFVVVNYTEGPAPAQASVHKDADDDDEYYEAPKPVQKTDTSSGSYGSVVYSVPSRTSVPCGLLRRPSWP